MKFPSASLFLVSCAATAGTIASFSPSFVSPLTRTFVPSTSVRNDWSKISTTASTKIKMSETATSDERKETFEFEAEVGRVMEIIINSLYSDRDVFLRELVSNAADACDKKRFLSITSDGEGELVEPEIKIKCDSVSQSLIIEDSGVGMTKDEVVNNLGRIAQSGTKKFLEALGSGKADVNLIGQFGVGFYSGFLVADKMTVQTKSMQPNSKTYTWESTADSSFTVKEGDDDVEPFESGSGTRIILELKEDGFTYLEDSKISELLVKYSEFIEFPISVWKEKTEYKQVPDEEANKDLKEGEEPKTKTVPETIEGYEKINNQKPIWLRSPKDVTEEEYGEFYKAAFRNSYDEPMKYTHFVLEGQVECKSVLYIPGMLPFELSRDMFDENAKNIRLYVKRVFINDSFEDLMPRWLKFVKGVVDSDDLPLNVGREILQKSKVLSIINKRLVRKSLDMIQEIEADEDESKYVMFWNNFGKYLKVGIVEDEKYKKDIAPLVRFFSSKSGDEYTSLDNYVENMPEGQKSIYYVTGDGKEKAALSPVIEKFTSRGYEVLYMVEPLDEITAQTLEEYKDFKIVDATKEGISLDDDDDEETKKKKEKLNEDFSSLREYLEATLSGKIQKVVVTDLLTDSPAALVQGAYGMSPTMQKYMKAQSVALGATGDVPGMDSMNQAVLEINPNHPIVQDLSRMVENDKDGEETKNFASLMYDVASMTGGYELSDTGEFANRVMALMTTKAQGGVQDAEIL